MDTVNDKKKVDDEKEKRTEIQKQFIKERVKHSV
jgi:hypothetical protein